MISIILTLKQAHFLQEKKNTKCLELKDITQSFMMMGKFLKECKKQSWKLDMLQVFATCEKLIQWIKSHKGEGVGTVAISCHL